MKSNTVAKNISEMNVNITDASGKIGRISENLRIYINSSPEAMKSFVETNPKVKKFIEDNCDKVNQQAFFMYFGIGYAKSSLVEIASELKSTRELVRQQKDKVIFQFVNHFREKPNS